jgi:nitrogen-specific signal transduction histidine kinase/CheY-like chemotaxis protein
MKDESGGFSTVIETTFDITERKNLEEQLRQSQKLETLGQLAGGVAHDFNNILASIMNYGYLLKGSPDNEKQKEYIERIIESTEKAALVTSDLLAFSRKQVLTTVPVKLNEIIKRVKELIVRIIGEQIEVKTILDHKVPSVMADSGKLEQILMNLATNARDAMPEGGTITIETNKAEIDKDFISRNGYGEPGEYALITVTDTGVGMDEETTVRIFEPFFTTKEVDKGSGLGLSIIYGIIKQHKGYIDVESKPGKGTAVKIYLPITEKKPKEEKPPVVDTVTKGCETILLAEDNTEVRLATKQILETTGYRVIEAVDGQDAVEKFNENKDIIQLLVFDSIMPNKSGKGAYDEIVKVNPDIKVLFISGYTEEIISDDGVPEEGSYFLSKPIAPDRLLKKIRVVLS